MKDKMKNTLEQEVELLGRSVSVLLIAGLLVVGGASAALLNSFGEITGDADVEQSVILDGQTYAQPEVSGFDESIVAGESIEGDNFDVENQASVPVDVDFTTTTEEFDPDDEGIDYEYTLLNTVSDGDSSEVENNVVRREDGFAVESRVDFDGSEDEAVSGVQFDLSSDEEVEYGEESITVDYSEGGDLTHYAPDWFVVGVELDSDENLDDYEEGDFVYIADFNVGRSGDYEDGSDYTFEDVDEYDIYVFDENDGEIDEVDTSEVSGTITYFKTATGTDFNEDDIFHVYYEEVEMKSDGDGLIESRTYSVDSDSQVEEVTLSPETDYTFGSHLNTNVYLEPNSEYSVTTDLATGEQ